MANLFILLFQISSNLWAAPEAFRLSIESGSELESVNPLFVRDSYADQVQRYVLDTLARRDFTSFEYKPRLAEKWEISRDQKTFTFTLRQGLVFHDGKPVTADDVKFSFESIFDKGFGDNERRTYYELIEKVEVLGPLQIRFKAKESYFQTFNALAELWILPKHIYSDPKRARRMKRDLVGSGPYRLKEWKAGDRLVLQKFPDWYGFQTADWGKTHQFEAVHFRFVRSQSLATEMARKRELDFAVISPEAFESKKGWSDQVQKFKVESSAPRATGFVGWNLKSPLFSDVRVRRALAHLMNREQMNQKYRRGQSALATGPFYLGSEWTPDSVKPLMFDLEKAKALLAEAGWVDGDKNGVLEKEIDGQKREFRFTLHHSNRDSEKYWKIFKQDLKQVGVDLQLKHLNWNAFVPLLNERKFEAVALAWQYPWEWDPKQVWHSASSEPGGSNFIGYSNPDVDDWIDEARVETNKSKRGRLLHKIFEKIAEDAPYVWMFDDRYTFYAVNQRISRPQDSLKFDLGLETWSVKAEAPTAPPPAPNP